MITTIDQMVDAAARVNLKAEIEQSLFDASDEIIQLQKGQLLDGMRSDDEQIFNVNTGSIFYSDSYARYKGKDEPIDLKDTGSFYEHIHTKQESEGLLIDSDDSKSEMLQETYGKEIFGPDTKSKEQLVPITGERLIHNLVTQLNER